MNVENETEELLVTIRQRAYNLMSTGRMMCSEAVLSVLNQGLGGDLPPDIAMKVAAGFPEGIAVMLKKILTGLFAQFYRK